MSSDRPALSPAGRSSSAALPQTSGALGRTWEQCAGLRESQSPLAALDTSVRFGDDFPEPIRYDAARGVLLYRGPMSHASFCFLRGLCDERNYHLSLERLFVATALPPARPVPWRFWAGAAAAAIVVLSLAWLGLSRLSPGSSGAPREGETVTAGGDVDGDGLPDLASHEVRPSGEGAGSR
jgi:hypothetical protein